MHALARQAIAYVHELGLPATAPRAYPGKGLPFFLTDAFVLVATEIVGRPVLLAIDQEADRPPTDVERLINQLKDAADAWPVYVTAALNSYNRKGLIERHISFIVPGRQFYAPGLGLDLREYYPKGGEPPKAQGLTPASQAMFIHTLVRKHWRPDWMPADTGAELGYSAMTASRVAAELVNAGLAIAETATRGKVRIVFQHGRRELWERALPLLRSPIQRTYFVRVAKRLPADAKFREAGLLALSHRTMLGEPKCNVYAMDRDAWRAWRHNAAVLPTFEPGAAQIEVWTYSPTLAPEGRAVDPFSLYLSLREDPDDRVQSALDELMEQVWQ